MNRRDFISKAAALGAGIIASPIIVKAGVGANDKIHIGLIGCCGQGFSNLKCYLVNPEVDCIAMCDIDKNILAQRAAETEKIQGKKVKYLYADWRKLIDNKDVDVVIIGTPDHWHCIQMIAACEAGKGVYVEKPLGHSIEECDLMVKAVKKYNSIVQVGQWQRSDPHWQDAVNFVHSGKLGNIRLVRVFSYQGWCKSIPVLPDEPTPDGVDYDMWLGPSPLRPFNRNRFHFQFRWFWDYAGGLMTDWGVHLLDYALYGMNVHTPNSIVASGGKFGYPDDACETPDSLQAIYSFDKFNIVWDHATGIDDGAYGRSHGVAFVGENGTLVVDRGGWEVIPEGNKMERITRQQAYGEGGCILHCKNHLECLKTNNPNTNANIEIGSHIAKFSELGNIAYKTGKKLKWDGERFDDAEANEYIRRQYREPWGLPKL